ncbi:SMC-Scp complex subunit ScpB [Candidatus Parcubacteria bacterium]|nr:SMC-Scp complex subunit ScpB [Candidatus Parcubacteria bacterium]
MISPPAQLEALLFASGEPIQKKRLASIIGVAPDMLAKAADALRAELSARGLSLVETDDALELRTNPEATELIKKLRENELSRDLGRAGLEVLALILYRGGATRGEIDFVRGVNSSQTIRSLLLRGLIEKTEDASDKRRPRYKATTDALAHLGVGTREELPSYNEFSAALKEREASEESEEVV